MELCAQNSTCSSHFHVTLQDLMTRLDTIRLTIDSRRTFEGGNNANAHSPWYTDIAVVMPTMWTP
ncbi:hypothetical protein GQ600_17631 [Phytophthora cactorum]|nr:hypothetical protein GQ600_17631 [Phytophthora cactorum]